MQEITYGEIQSAAEILDLASDAAMEGIDREMEGDGDAGLIEQLKTMRCVLIMGSRMLREVADKDDVLTDDEWQMNHMVRRKVDKHATKVEKAGGSLILPEVDEEKN